MSHTDGPHGVGCQNHFTHAAGDECRRPYGTAGEACGDGFCDKAARESARMGTLGGIADALKQPMYGIAQQARAPGKMFTRSDILAVLRAHRGVAGNVADAEYQKLIAAFEAME